MVLNVALKRCTTTMQCKARGSARISRQLRALSRLNDRPVPHDARETYARSGVRPGVPAPVIADVTVPQSAPVVTAASRRLRGHARDASLEVAPKLSRLPGYPMSWVVQLSKLREPLWWYHKPIIRPRGMTCNMVEPMSLPVVAFPATED